MKLKMNRRTQQKHHLPPGTFIYTGNINTPTKYKTISFDEKVFKLEDKLAVKETKNNWIMVIGLKDSEAIKDLLLSYDVDNLVIEDILNVNQKSKIETFNDYIFSVFKCSYLVDGEINHDYVSSLFFKDKIITFHESENTLFEEILTRIQDNKGIIRKMGLDYLYYVIIDSIVDNFIHVNSSISMDVDEIENQIISSENFNQSNLYFIRKELLYIRNNITMLNEQFNKKFYVANKLIDANCEKYFNDVGDHLSRLDSELTNEREIIRNILDMHMNNISNRMNSIMKTLTIFSAIFIPLSFLAGVFGMNFTHFPGLTSEYGFYVFVFACIIIVTGMIIFFKNKKWL